MTPSDYLSFACTSLGSLRRQDTDAIVVRIRAVQKMLEPTCGDTVTAVVDLGAILADLEKIPMRPATGVATNTDTLKQDPTPERLPGVAAAMERVQQALELLQRNGSCERVTV